MAVRQTTNLVVYTNLDKVFTDSSDSEPMTNDSRFVCTNLSKRPLYAMTRLHIIACGTNANFSNRF